MSIYTAASGQSGLFRLVLSYAKRQTPWLIAVLIASITLMAAQIFLAILTGRIMNLSIQGMRSKLLTPIALFLWSRRVWRGYDLVIPLCRHRLLRAGRQ